MLIIVILWCSLAVVLSQNIPLTPCPQHFQYQSNNGSYFGKITLPSCTSDIIELKIELENLSLSKTNSSSLTLFESQQKTLANIQAGLPISYRVNFDLPMHNGIPKLIKITVNGANVCVNNEYSEHRKETTLTHTLNTKITRNRYRRRAQVPETFLTDPFLHVSVPKVIKRTTTTTPTPTTEKLAQNLTPSWLDCGKQQVPTLTTFIRGGSFISRGQYPWLAAIYHKQRSDQSYICGGTLISSLSILTAAHCFKQLNILAENTLAYLGRHDLGDLDEDGFVLRSVQDLIINPEYKPNSIPDADIAIMKLKKAVRFTQYIQPICLWSESDDLTRIIGQKGYVAGWGTDETGQVSLLPKMVDAKIVTEGECLRSLEAFKGLTSSRTLCAGNLDNNGPCKGDSGAALMMNRNGRWMVRGVVSLGQTINSQCNLKQYVVYCDVAKHISWVRKNML